MPITSRSEYGMRAMILLAEQSGEDLLSASEMSRREHIPLKYLEQILAELKREGLVLSQPGARGGYRLARPSGSIQVGEIVRTLDGAFTPQPCVAEGEREPCALEAGCKLRPLWSRLHHAVQSVLSSTTLEQLALERGVRPEPAPEPVIEDQAEAPAAADAADPTRCGVAFLLQPY